MLLCIFAFIYTQRTLVYGIRKKGMHCGEPGED